MKRRNRERRGKGATEREFGSAVHRALELLLSGAAADSENAAQRAVDELSYEEDRVVRRCNQVEIPSDERSRIERTRHRVFMSQGMGGDSLVTCA